MGVDVYLGWDGMTEDDKQAQYTGFANAGKLGYLRGAYFGGLSDVLRQILHPDLWTADEEPFGEDMQEFFALEVAKLEHSNGRRPGDFYAPEGMENIPEVFAKLGAEVITTGYGDERVEPEITAQYWDFLSLAKQKTDEGKNPTVLVSY